MMDLAEKQAKIEHVIAKEIVNQTRRTSNLIDLMDDLINSGALSSSLDEYNLALLNAKLGFRKLYLKGLGGHMDETEEKMWDKLYDILNSSDY